MRMIKYKCPKCKSRLKSINFGKNFWACYNKECTLFRNNNIFNMNKVRIIKG